jgi:hypothetical protein
MKPDLDFVTPVKPRRKRGWNMLIMVVVTVCLWMAGMGLARVATTNAMDSLGRQRRVVEKDISDLELASNNADLAISEALARPDVKERLMASRTRLKKIKSGDIVYLTVNHSKPDSVPQN